MGWLFNLNNGQSKADFVKERIQPQNGVDGTKFICAEHSLKGNVLYAVWCIKNADGTEKARFIGIDLLAKRRGEGWGFKDQEESSGVYEYDCPIRYFNLVPDPGGFATEWRKKVIEKANNKKVASKSRKMLNIGDKVITIKGCSVPELEVVSVKPKLIGVYNGRQYRIVPRHIHEVQKGAQA